MEMQSIEKSTNGFIVGNLVQLNSGGPRMTIDSLEIDTNDKIEYAHCIWFHGDEKKFDDFNVLTLARYS